MGLEKLGARGVAIDNDETAVALCQTLAVKGAQDVEFEAADPDVFINRLDADQYDLVLGAEAFQDIVFRHGVATARVLFAKLAARIPYGVFELGPASAPTLETTAQTRDPRGLMSPYSCVARIDSLPNTAAGARRDLYFASTKSWYIGGIACDFDFVTETSNELFPSIHSGTRQFFICSNTIAKRYDLTHPELGQRNLIEWQRERDYLSAPPAGIGASPKLLATSQSDTEVWLARERLKGQSLAELITAGGQKPDPERILQNILSELVTLECAGLYHDDVRIWNVLILENQQATLVDYGSISRSPVDCTWPHNIFLSFLVFMREVFGFSHLAPTPLRSPRFDPERLPEPWQTGAKAFLAAPTEKWSFAFLRECLNNQRPDTSAASNIFELARVVEEAADEFVSQTTHLRNELHKAKMRSVDWRNQVALRRAQVVQLRGEVAGLAGAISDRDKTIATMRDEITTLELKNASLLEIQSIALKEAVTGLERDIASIRHSTSWRLTAPLRAIKISLLTSRAFAKSRLRIVGEHGLEFVRRRPTAKRLVLRASGVVPPLKRRLVAFAEQRRGEASPPSATPQERDLSAYEKEVLQLLHLSYHRSRRDR